MKSKKNENTSTGSSDEGDEGGFSKGSVSTERKAHLFRHTAVAEEDLQLLTDYVKNGDGGALAVAWQAVAVF